MENSILKTTKKDLGIVAENTDFDAEIITKINSVFSTLNQLGIGPENGFQIEDATPTWDLFYGTNKKYNSVRTYMSLRVRLLFDPPTTSYHMDAVKSQLEELEYRLSVLREETEWVSPEPTPPLDGELILDGGSA